MSILSFLVWRQSLLSKFLYKFVSMISYSHEVVPQTDVMNLITTKRVSHQKAASSLVWNH